MQSIIKKRIGSFARILPYVVVLALPCVFGLIAIGYAYANLTPITGKWIAEDYMQGGGGRPYLISDFHLQLESSENGLRGGHEICGLSCDWTENVTASPARYDAGKSSIEGKVGTEKIAIVEAASSRSGVRYKVLLVGFNGKLYWFGLSRDLLFDSPRADYFPARKTLTNSKDYP